MRSLALVLVTACGATPPGASGAHDRCWPVEAFRIEVLEHGREWEPVFVVTDAGEVYRSEQRGDPRARFTATGDTDTFTIQSTDVEMVLTCGTDHVVSVVGKPFKLTYDDRDGLSEGDKIAVYVAPDGEVHETMGDKVVFGPGGDDTTGHARVVGDIARIRRTAEMVLFVAMGL